MLLHNCRIVQHLKDVLYFSALNITANSKSSLFYVYQYIFKFTLQKWGRTAWIWSAAPYWTKKNTTCCFRTCFESDRNTSFKLGVIFGHFLILLSPFLKSCLPKMGRNSSLGVISPQHVLACWDEGFSVLLRWGWRGFGGVFMLKWKQNSTTVVGCIIFIFVTYLLL